MQNTGKVKYQLEISMLNTKGPWCLACLIYNICTQLFYKGMQILCHSHLSHSDFLNGHPQYSPCKTSVCTCPTYLSTKFRCLTCRGLKISRVATIHIDDITHKNKKSRKEAQILLTLEKHCCFKIIAKLGLSSQSHTQKPLFKFTPSIKLFLSKRIPT